MIFFGVGKSDEKKKKIEKIEKDGKKEKNQGVPVAAWKTPSKCYSFKCYSIKVFLRELELTTNLTSGQKPCNHSHTTDR